MARWMRNDRSRKLIWIVLVASLTVGPIAGDDKLSAAETALQGTWKARSGWELTFEGRTFNAKSGEAWYQGTFVAPASEKRPAHLDLKIDDCNCAYKGMTSLSIYQWEEGDLLMSGGTPGKTRPPIFDDTMGLVLEMKRVESKPSADP